MRKDKRKWKSTMLLGVKEIEDYGIRREWKRVCYVIWKRKKSERQVQLKLCITALYALLYTPLSLPLPHHHTYNILFPSTLSITFLSSP